MIDIERERKRQRYRRREKQAPCQEPDAGLDPGTSGSRPEPKAGAKPLSHPGIPFCSLFNHFPVGKGDTCGVPGKAHVLAFRGLWRRGPGVSRHFSPPGRLQGSSLRKTRALYVWIPPGELKTRG